MADEKCSPQLQALLDEAARREPGITLEEGRAAFSRLSQGTSSLPRLGPDKIRAMASEIRERLAAQQCGKRLSPRASFLTPAY